MHRSFKLQLCLQSIFKLIFNTKSYTITSTSTLHILWNLADPKDSPSPGVTNHRNKRGWFWLVFAAVTNVLLCDSCWLMIGLSDRCETRETLYLFNLTRHRTRSNYRDHSQSQMFQITTCSNSAVVPLAKIQENYYLPVQYIIDYIWMCFFMSKLSRQK